MMLEALVELLRPLAYVVHAALTAAVLYFNAAMWFGHRRKRAVHATGDPCSACGGSPAGFGAERCSERGGLAHAATVRSATWKPVDAVLWTVAAVASVAPVIAITTIDWMRAGFTSAFSPYSDALLTGPVATLLLCHPLAIMLHAIGVILLTPRDGSRRNLAGTSLLALVTCAADSAANLSLLP